MLRRPRPMPDRSNLARRAAALVLCTSLALLAVAAQGVRDVGARLAVPAPVPDGRASRLEGLEGFACAECHAEIVDEWASSMHALAWKSEPYQQELVGRRKAESCHGCHVPQPLQQGQLGERPLPRPNDRHLGISCDSCHLGPEGRQLGPSGAATDAHPTARSDSMVGAGTNRLCTACHRTTVGPVIGIAKDYELSERPARGETCVECHYAALKTVAFEGGERVVRSHALQTPRDPAFLALAFELALRVEAGRTWVDVHNRAGHRVPGFVGREIEFEAQALDAAGKVVAEGRVVLDSTAYLPIDESLAIELGAAAAKVRVVGLHHDPRLKRPVEFLRVELAP